MGSGPLVSISEQILCCCRSGDVTLKLLEPEQKSVHWFENSYAIQQVVLWGGRGWIKDRSYDGDLETITQWVLEAEHFEVTNLHQDLSVTVFHEITSPWHDGMNIIINLNSMYCSTNKWNDERFMSCRNPNYI